MSYSVKEMHYTLQGEGAQSGRPAIFCRFSKCNLWNGRESDRENSVCTFCDTDFVGTDGANGGVFQTAQELVEKVKSLWPQESQATPFVVSTGGEPALQLNQELLDAFHHEGIEVAIETNGTLPLPKGLDWVCVSPKGRSKVVVDECDELKIAYPQVDLDPEQFGHIRTRYYFLTPIAEPLNKGTIYPGDDANTKKAIQYCLDHPKWRLNLQTHKVVNIA